MEPDEKTEPTQPRRVDFDPEAVITTCPNCSARLEVRRCQLVCPRCHYYLSCAEYL